MSPCSLPVLTRVVGDLSGCRSKRRITRGGGGTRSVPSAGAVHGDAGLARGSILVSEKAAAATSAYAAGTAESAAGGAGARVRVTGCGAEEGDSIRREMASKAAVVRAVWVIGVVVVSSIRERVASAESNKDSRCLW